MASMIALLFEGLSGDRFYNKHRREAIAPEF